jgi:hypothetical protein
MLTFYFLFSKPLVLDCPIEDRHHIDKTIMQHLGLEMHERYIVHLFPHADEENSYNTFIDDIASYDRFTDIHSLPRSVNPDRLRRTVWINPPSIEEKMGNERSVPWNTHYTEYYQIYPLGSVDKNNIYTIKYWKHFKDLEMYDPTPLALARYDYLESLQQEKEQKETELVEEAKEEEAKDTKDTKDTKE